jgi:hypothetical protein
VDPFIHDVVLAVRQENHNRGSTVCQRITSLPPEWARTFLYSNARP